MPTTTPNVQPFVPRPSGTRLLAALLYIPAPKAPEIGSRFRRFHQPRPWKLFHCPHFKRNRLTTIGRRRRRLKGAGKLRLSSPAHGPVRYAPFGE
jgi:hypothetical protein